MQIYAEASRYFQLHETDRRWLRDCAQLQMRFGRWTEFTSTESITWPVGRVGIVWVRGQAQFEKGSAEVRLDWDLSGDRPALNNLLIETGGEQTSIPGFTGDVRD